MNWKHLLLTWLAAFIILFGVGFIWHISLLGDFQAKQVGPNALPQMALSAVVISELVRGLVMAFIYPLGYQGGGPAAEGARFGLLMGVFSAMIPLFYLGQLTFTTGAWFWVEGLFYVVQGLIAGVGIGVVHARLTGRET